MNRKNFLQTAALSAGALAVSSMARAGIMDPMSLNLLHDHEKMDPKIITTKEGKGQVVLGDHQIVKLNGKDTNGQFTLIEQYNDPGLEIPMHIHTNEDEIFHVLAGELQVKIGEETKILKSGDLGFCPRGIPHSWKVVGSRKARVMLSIFPSGLELMFGELATLPAGPPDFEKVSTICSKYNIRFV